MWQYLGCASEAQGNSPEALAYYQKAIELSLGERKDVKGIAGVMGFLTAIMVITLISNVNIQLAHNPGEFPWAMLVNMLGVDSIFAVILVGALLDVYRIHPLGLPDEPARAILIAEQAWHAADGGKSARRRYKLRLVTASLLSIVIGSGGVIFTWLPGEIQLGFIISVVDLMIGGVMIGFTINGMLPSNKIRWDAPTTRFRGLQVSYFISSCLLLGWTLKDSLFIILNDTSFFLFLLSFIGWGLLGIPPRSVAPAKLVPDDPPHRV